MKTLLTALGLGVALQAYAGEIVVQRVNGDVSVRHGVTETWMRVAPGDVLKPDDTMKTGRRGGAVLVADAVKAGSRKVITLPEEVIVDLSDIREL